MKFILSLLLGWTLCTSVTTAAEDKKPNILFIAIDDLNDWTDMLKGNPQAKTPQMDRLAAKGMLFANAHCAAPACGPSRSAIMSGSRPSTSGNYINKSSLIHNPILNNSVLLGGWARQADWGPCHPDVTLDDHPDGITANWATEKLLEGELQEPFFLGAGIFQPHLPNYAPHEYFDRFPLEEIELPEGYREDDLEDVPAAHSKMAHNPWLQRIRATGQWKPAIQAYLACTAMVDDLIGQIVRALEKSKYADNTIIVLWSDHGFQLGEKERWSKYSLWERATRVNMIWVAPGVTQPGSTSARPVNLLDIYPTLASLTGIEPPEGQLEGNDLSVLMKDPDAAWDEATVTTFGYKNYGVRSERYRYILYEDGTEELYDHSKDKWEWENLADNPEYAAIKKKMRKEIPAHHEPYGVAYKVPKRKRKGQ